jgi:hypothetical protein
MPFALVKSSLNTDNTALKVRTNDNSIKDDNKSSKDLSNRNLVSKESMQSASLSLGLETSMLSLNSKKKKNKIGSKNTTSITVDLDVKRNGNPQLSNQSMVNAAKAAADSSLKEVKPKNSTLLMASNQTISIDKEVSDQSTISGALKNAKIEGKEGIGLGLGLGLGSHVIALLADLD